MTDAISLLAAVLAFVALAALPFALDALVGWRHRRAAKRRTRIEIRDVARLGRRRFKH